MASDYKSEDWFGGNGPKWPGASSCYTRAYELLEKWAAEIRSSVMERGEKANASEIYVKCISPRGQRDKSYIAFTPQMKELQEALGKGDEHKIKDILLQEATKVFLRSR